MADFRMGGSEDLAFENPFWSFACRLHEQCGVAHSCIEAQSGRETLEGLELLSEQLVCAYLFRASTEFDERRCPLATADAVAENIDLVLRLSGAAADHRRELAAQLAAAAQATA
jgi:hypothetical protein